jgi:hypothetical protein
MRTKRDANDPNFVDPKKLEDFVEKVNREAKKLFPGEDGEGLLDIDIRDCTRYMDVNGIPVRHLHELNDELKLNDKDFRDALRLLICNAKLAADRVSTSYQLFELRNERKDNLNSLFEELDQLARELGREIIFAKNTYPNTPQGKRNWKPVGLQKGENEYTYYYDAKDLYESHRKEILEYVSKIIQVHLQNYGTFLVVLTQGNVIRVCVPV